MDKLIEKLKDKLALLPQSSGVYSMLDAAGNIIYIGKAKNLKSRVSSYFTSNQPYEKVRQMMTQVHDFDYVVTHSELDALTLESNLVHQHMPFYNILLKDGKAFPYLKINLKEDFPRVVLTRRVKNDGALYFGPFFGSVKVADLLQIIHHTFLLRDCSLNITVNSKPRRVCLNYHIGRCLGPCAKLVTKQGYAKQVDGAVNFLKGNTTYAKNLLTEKMMKCAQLQQFERAQEYKESLQMIDSLNNLIITDLGKLKDIDIFGYNTNGITSAISVLCVRGGKMIGVNNFNINSAEDGTEALESFITQYYLANSAIPNSVICCLEDNSTLAEWLRARQGRVVEVLCPKRGVNLRLLNMAEENARVHLQKNLELEKLHKLKTVGALKNLQAILQLPQLPFRIEGFDISNLSGTNTVASMVVFENAKPLKKHYRKFKLQTDKQNDVDSMRQVLERRISALSGQDVSFKKLPNLILIDGGKGQLSAAVNVLKTANVNIPIISLAEKTDDIFLPNLQKPITLPKNSYALRLLQTIRDESHRFAVSFQRSLRLSTTLTSQLSAIDLIGPQKIKALFAHFKSLAAIKNASVAELMQVNGIGRKLAENIHHHFNLTLK